MYRFFLDCLSSYDAYKIDESSKNSKQHDSATSHNLIIGYIQLKGVLQKVHMASQNPRQHAIIIILWRLQTTVFFDQVCNLHAHNRTSKCISSGN
jgi:hypothetical protein